MYVAGIDAHATYLVLPIVSKTGALVQKTTHVANGEAERLLELLRGFQGQLQARRARWRRCLARMRVAGLIPVYPMSIEQPEQALLVPHPARLVRTHTPPLTGSMPSSHRSYRGRVRSGPECGLT